LASTLPEREQKKRPGVARGPAEGNAAHSGEGGKKKERERTIIPRLTDKSRVELAG